MYITKLFIDLFGGVPDSTECVESQVACRDCPMDPVKIHHGIKVVDNNYSYRLAA